MALPISLQQFKAAGIYRVVYDKSTVLGVDSNILRLVVGYSEKGPFNIPVYVKNVQDFRTTFGDPSKTLEKRGIYFHQTCIDALAAGPILALNLKKFKDETVDGASISTEFNPTYEIIDEVKINVEDIYDTSRFWELSPERLNGLNAGGSAMNNYINIAAVSTKGNSSTYFIRKANGSKVSAYKMTVNDWYENGADEIPEYLENFKQNLMSDFFAEIYVFKGKFEIDQVMASSTLKNYFYVLDGKLTVKPFVTNAFGDSVDALDALYNDSTANGIGHYIGSLIPYLKDKNGNYVSLDIIFNLDSDYHNMMISFNKDLIEEDGELIDLSGRHNISDTSLKAGHGQNVTLDSIFNGTAKTKSLGNSESYIVANTTYFYPDVLQLNDDHTVNKCIFPYSYTDYKINGALYVKGYAAEEGSGSAAYYNINLSLVNDNNKVTHIRCPQNDPNCMLGEMLVKLGAATVSNTKTTDELTKYVWDDQISAYAYTYFAMNANCEGTYFNEDSAFVEETGGVKTTKLEGPQTVITAISKLERVNDGAYDKWTDEDSNMKIVKRDVNIVTYSEYVGGDTTNSLKEDNVYGSSVTFINVPNMWNGSYLMAESGAFISYSLDVYDSSLLSICQVGDCFLADEADPSNKELPRDNVFVQEMGHTNPSIDPNIKYYVKFTGKPKVYNTNYLVRIDGALNQEIGTMNPQYLEGYTFKSDRPEGNTMLAKLNWQKNILSALTDYTGLRTGLLNKSDIDYRYVIDSFESYIDTSLKDILTFLAKEKQSAFAICNFPAVKTFVKCPYTSFTDNRGVFNVQYVVNGYNKKKVSTRKFSLPSEADGASFCAFYTPLKFSDGYIDQVRPSAGLVSNLFINKYTARHPYSIVAGPNYGVMNAAGLIGPDYNYSMDELQIIEPFGVNCMVYRTGFGTFINANQTAKQTPVSALSSVNVRELVIFIQDEIEKVLQAYQWEFNNANTRNAILDKANSICATAQANGGIQKFLNVMDESNNTPDIIDNEMAIIQTHIEPGRGCGKMIQELTLYRTGGMDISITES